jgi:[ribosomal protein S5]-alanine N-acetyltransferase
MTFDLDTPRLHLRPIDTDDLEEVLRLWTDPDVRRFLWDDIVISTDRVVTEINRSIASFYIYRFGIWALSLLPDPRIIGFCGLRRFGDSTDVELLYGLYPQYWHHGLAAEASRAVLRYGFERLDLERIYAGSDPPNSASRKLIERLGMTFVKRLRINERDADYFAITWSEYQSSAPGLLGQ